MSPTSWVFAFLGLSGIVLAWRGLRGAPRLTAPRCARCRYDVRVTLREGKPQCPECGGLLTGPHSVQFGRQPLSPVKLGLGAVLIAVTVLYGSNIMVQRRTGFRWRQLQPTSSLIRALDDPSALHDAWAVLEKRYVEDELSDEELAQTIDALIATMVKSGATSLQGRGIDGLVVMAREDGRISEGQWSRLLEQMFAGPPRIDCRDRVRKGNLMPISARSGGAQSSGLVGVRAVARIERILLDGELLLHGDSAVLMNAPPGEHTLDVHVDIGVTDSKRPLSSRPGSDDMAQMTHRWSVVGSVPITVLQPDEYPFERVTDPAEVAAFRDTIEVRRVVIDSRRSQLEVELQFDPPANTAICYEVLVRVGDDEREIGRLQARRGRFSGSCRVLNRTSMRQGGPARVVFDRSSQGLAGGDRIDIILRPDLAAAEKDARLEVLLDAEIVIENVPVETE